MPAAPEEPFQHAPEKDTAPTPVRKPWQTPRFIVSEVIAETRFGAGITMSDSPYSQNS